MPLFLDIDHQVAAIDPHYLVPFFSIELYPDIAMVIDLNIIDRNSVGQHHNVVLVFLLFFDF